MLGLVALICTVLIGIAYSFSWFYTLEAGLTDRFFTVQPVGHDTIIIAVDEESLAAIGQWPWSRATHATLLNKIGAAKIVAFDVLFTEPSSQGDTDDEALALAIKNFKGTVVLPQVIDEQSNRVKDPVLVLKEVSQTGFVNSATDRDGVVRSAAITRGGMLSYDGVVAGAEAVASDQPPLGLCIMVQLLATPLFHIKTSTTARCQVVYLQGKRFWSVPAQLVWGTASKHHLAICLGSRSMPILSVP